MKVSLITCTGGRPECFSLSEQFIRNQTYKGSIEFIVVDDCTPNTKPSLEHKYIRGPSLWEPKVNTQRGNMLEALKHVTGDVIFIWEDDDFFRKDYIETLLHFLKYSDITGIGESRYYNVTIPGHITMPNFGHASLSQTAFKASLLPFMKEAVNSGEMYFDICLWRKVKEQRIPWTLLHNTNLSIGMKGMPGRLGITPSHTTKKYYHDANYNKLKEWIGSDIEYYLPYLRQRKTLKEVKV